MKLALPRAALVGILGRVTRAVENRSTIPILSNVLLRADAAKDGGHLVVRATDLDVEMSERVAAKVEATGALTVPAKTLADVARKLPEGEVTLEERETGLSVRAGRSRFLLQTLPADDYPDLAAGELPVGFTLAGATLKAALESVDFAISTEETRYYLNGVYIHAHESRLRFVATNGHQLALAEIDLPAGSASVAGIILPRKAALETMRLLGESDVRVEISPSKARLTFGDSLVLTTKLIDGTFPDYQRVIPQANGRRCGIETAPFAAAIDRVGAIATERGRAVKLQLDRERLTVSVRQTEGGSAEEEVDVEHDGDAFEIGFNAKYLADICARLPARAEMMLDAPGSPTILRAGPEARTLFVLMPMRV